jgi:DNA-binding response OmpR family regulator
MAKILICEPDERCRALLSYILEGIHHRVVETDAYAALPAMIAADPPDLLILGVHAEETSHSGASHDWRPALPDLPVLLLFAGPTELRDEFLAAWDGPKSLNVLAQPLEPYPLLAMVKSMVTAPEIWRRGGQHKV